MTLTCTPCDKDYFNLQQRRTRSEGSVSPVPWDAFPDDEEEEREPPPPPQEPYEQSSPCDDACNDPFCCQERHRLMEENKRLQAKLDETLEIVKDLVNGDIETTGSQPSSLARLRCHSLSGPHYQYDDAQSVAASSVYSHASTVKAGTSRLTSNNPAASSEQNVPKRKKILRKLKKLRPRRPVFPKKTSIRDEVSLASGSSSQAQCSVSSFVDKEEDEKTTATGSSSPLSRGSSSPAKNNKSGSGMSSYAKRYLMRLTPTDSTDSESETSPSQGRAEF